MKKRDYIYIALHALFCPIVILTLILALAKTPINNLIFSTDHLLTVTGIIVSTVGLVFTVYFVVLAVSARKIQKEIEDTQQKYEVLENKKQNIQDDFNELNRSKDKIQSDFTKLNAEKDNLQFDLNKLKQHTEESDKQITELKTKIEKTETILLSYAETLYDELDIQIALAEKLKSIELRNTLKIRRARLSYRYPMLDVETRIKLLLELGHVGNNDDIKFIENIIESANELQEIKTIAKIVLEELKKRLGIN
jgi:chromosome segregation ATPase